MNNFSNKNLLYKCILYIIVAIIITPVFIAVFIDSPYFLSIEEMLGIGYYNDTTDDSVSFLNVGQGDSALIESNGSFVLIDTGDGESTDIIRSLKQNGVTDIDTLILTHWHSDHTGGVQSIFNNFKVSNIVIPRMPDYSDEQYEIANTVNDIAEKYGARFYVAKQGLAIKAGDFRITVLYCNPDNDEENNRSAVIMARCRDFKFLFTADAEILLEKEMLNYGINFDCDILKVGHHGSNSSTCDAFLDVCTPDYAIISVGVNNAYKHPSSDVLRRLVANDIQVLRTDKNGEIDVYVMKDELQIATSFN